MKSLIKVAILVATVILIIFGMAHALKLFGIGTGPVTRLIPSVSTLIGTLLFLNVVDHKNPNDIGLHSFKATLVLDGLMFALALLPLFIGILINKGFALNKTIDITLLSSIGFYLIVGFSEELFARGYIYHTVAIERLKAAVSALSFAGMHFISREFTVLLFVLYFIFGMTKARMFKSIKSLWPLIMFHAVWDLAANYTGFYRNPLIDLLCLGIALVIVIYVTKKKTAAVAGSAT